MSTPVDVSALNAAFESASAADILRMALDEFGSGLTLASSLGAEDQVLTHMWHALQSPVDVFMLDTGRLHQATYTVMQATMDAYNIQYRVMYPLTDSVEQFTKDVGPNAMYASLKNRQTCCHIRKVEPLSRALTGYRAWITGIRRGQSIERSQTPAVEWDAKHGVVKINPLIHWSKSETWDYIRAHQVPYNTLHDDGYPSIGCAPCTRPVPVGEDDRSGRWWWEDTEKKECGLHVPHQKET